MSHRLEPSLESPASTSRIVLFASLALGLGIGAAYLMDRPRGPECSGYLVCDSTFVTAKVETSVVALSAPEGKPIRIGEPLIVLRDDKLNREIIAQKQEIHRLNSLLQQAVAQAELELNWRMRTLDSEICEIQLRSAGYLKEKYDFELQKNMFADVLSGNAVALLTDDPLLQPVSLNGIPAVPERLTTVMQMEAASNAVEVSNAQVEICATRERSLQQLRENLPQQVRGTAGVDIAEANLSRAKEVLADLEARQQDLTITSPAIGRVGVYNVRPGDQLKRGDAIVALLDEARRHLIVHVPSDEITKFQGGTAVSLTFPGGIRRSGEVTEVAPQTDPGNADPVVLVRVEQSGAVWPEVPTGSRVRVRLAK